MSSIFAKSITSISVIAVLLAGATGVNADPLSTELIDGEQMRQVTQQQDQTQFRNRQRLEERINGTGDGSAAQQHRNRYQHREQKRYGEQSHGREFSSIPSGGLSGASGFANRSSGSRSGGAGGGRR